MADGYTLIDGFRCYAPQLITDHADYPSEGFDVTVEVEKRSFWCRTRNRVLNIILDSCGAVPPLTMLEIGCGTGTVLASLKDRQGLTLTGSEIYLQGLRYARQRLPGVDFIQLDATNIPFHDEYDIVGAFDVLEHIDADEQVMREVAKALKPGGLFLITVPQYPWMWSQLDEIVHHKRRYTKRELTSKLEKAGYDVVRTTSFVTALFPMMAAARLRDRGRRSEDAKQAFEDQVLLPAPVNTLFDWIMRLDEFAIRLGLSLPFGGSLLAVARKR